MPTPLQPTSLHAPCGRPHAAPSKQASCGVRGAPRSTPQLLFHPSCFPTIKAAVSPTTLQERRLSEAALQKAAEQAFELLRSGDAAATMADFRLAERAGQALGDAQHAVRSVRSAGEIIAGAAAAQAAERR